MSDEPGWGGWRPVPRAGFRSAFDDLAQSMRLVLRARGLGVDATTADGTCRRRWSRVPRPPPGTVIEWPHDLRLLAIELGFDPDRRAGEEIDGAGDARIAAPPPPHRPAGAAPAPTPSLAEARALRDEYAARVVASHPNPNPHAPFAMVAGFEAAGERGELDAHLELAECYRRAWGVTRNEAKASAALVRGAEQGSRACVLELLAQALARPDEEAQRQADRVSRWASRALADDHDGRGHVLVGWAAYRGIGGPPSSERCFALQSEAAARGNRDAHFELYCLLSKGEGVPRDEAAALSHLTTAAELGQMRACHSLGAHHARGTGVPQSWPDAVRWYARAAELGNPLSAQTLATMYETGEGVERDATRAAYYRGQP